MGAMENFDYLRRFVSRQQTDSINRVTDTYRAIVGSRFDLPVAGLVEEARGGLCVALAAIVKVVEALLVSGAHVQAVLLHDSE